ncbi:hypothetical protein G7K_4297-t1 [Saitoella complicata NRRL Y-17804]|uniref:Uncharacterized protein n=1 Tax=Saitoella complicata (strain BCRC 22490 / CBS 7301 / JCM 7358 / NBRC 10748 / NRRL Y-17804) TaxID=698492 RepID=A0A0E9NK30_SAICN|nr:hypothetical protein G7K_4297-t1 [Saitoella complicata NRRL Y-17804]
MRPATLCILQNLTTKKPQNTVRSVWKIPSSKPSRHYSRALYINTKRTITESDPLRAVATVTYFWTT